MGFRVKIKCYECGYTAWIDADSSALERCPKCGSEHTELLKVKWIKQN